MTINIAIRDWRISIRHSPRSPGENYFKTPGGIVYACSNLCGVGEEQYHHALQNRSSHNNNCRTLVYHSIFSKVHDVIQWIAQSDCQYEPFVAISSPQHATTLKEFCVSVNLTPPAKADNVLMVDVKKAVNELLRPIEMCWDQLDRSAQPSQNFVSLHAQSTHLLAPARDPA